MQHGREDGFEKNIAQQLFGVICATLQPWGLSDYNMQRILLLARTYMQNVRYKLEEVVQDNACSCTLVSPAILSH